MRQHFASLFKKSLLVSRDTIFQSFRLEGLKSGLGKWACLGRIFFSPVELLYHPNMPKAIQNVRKSQSKIAKCLEIHQNVHRPKFNVKKIRDIL